MKIKDLSKSIELAIDNYESSNKFKSFGYVLQAGDGIARVYGLNDVMLGEFISFSKPNVFGMALNLEEDSVGIILFGDSEILKEGDKAYGTGNLLKIPVSQSLLGRVISPIGHLLDSGEKIDDLEMVNVFNDAAPMFERESVKIPLETGIKIIDGLIPIGRGQRELIIGDRHTGKSSIAIETILNQKDKDVISIYVAIGQKPSSVAKVLKTFRENNLKNYIIVSSYASDSASLQYIAPYAACAIAEYFMNRGKHTLIVYDDLSKHAIAYREISLLLKRSVGREAYPGDIFFIHSKLLERSAMLKSGGSMTALPIVETLAGDVSAYIPTNIISITDGQIYLDTKLFNSGIRPSIDPTLSVSRVGGDAQIKSMKKVSGPIKISYSQFKELESFSKLSADLDHETKNRITRGKKLVKILTQDMNNSVDTSTQVAIFYAFSQNYLDRLDISKIDVFQDLLKEYLLKDEDLKRDIMTSDLNKDLSKRLDVLIDRVIDNV
jgi:F-type H+-transporting ATPase subunit alpha